METVSTKPYLIRAIHEWCTDQSLTPYLAAQVDHITRVPAGYAKDGQIVLNLSAHATDRLQISNTEITFMARFGGAVHNLYIPIKNVVAIYAKENGQGMGFEFHPQEAPSHADSIEDLHEENGLDSFPNPEDPPPTSPRPSGRPQLKVVK